MEKFDYNTWATIKEKKIFYLKEAIKNKNIVEILYKDVADGFVITRKISPLQIRKQQFVDKNGRSQKGDCLEAYSKFDKSNKIYVIKNLNKLKVLEQDFDDDHKIIESKINVAYKDHREESINKDIDDFIETS